MDFFTFFTACQNYRPPTPLLSHECRKRMHSLGWTEVHYSDMSRGSECPYSLYLSILSDEDGGKTHGIQRRVSAHALCGSVMHAAFKDHENTCEAQADGVTLLGLDPWYWRQLFLSVIDNDPLTVYVHDGAQVTDKEIDLWSQRFCSRDTWGLTVAEMIRKAKYPLLEQGWIFTDNERWIDYQDGDTFPVHFAGTIDVVAVYRGMRFILDLKTYGMWRVLFDGKGSVSAQNPDAESLQYLRQLRHYDWLYRQVTSERADGIGLILPANALPYKKSGAGYQAGDAKGPTCTTAPVLPMQQMKAYERDMVKQIETWVLHGMTRAYPETFGKPQCPSCFFFEACIKDSKTSISQSQQRVLDNYR